MSSMRPPRGHSNQWCATTAGEAQPKTSTTLSARPVAATWARCKGSLTLDPKEHPTDWIWAYVAKTKKKPYLVAGILVTLQRIHWTRWCLLVGTHQTNRPQPSNCLQFKRIGQAGGKSHVVLVLYVERTFYLIATSKEHKLQSDLARTDLGATQGPPVLHWEVWVAFWCAVWHSQGPSKVHVTLYATQRRWYSRGFIA